MINAAEVIKALWDGNFGFSGNPQTEEEFNKSFMPVSEVDEFGVNVFETDPLKFPVTWAQFNLKRAEMTAEYDRAEYQRLRAKEYPPITNYIDGVVKGDQAQIQAYIDECLAVKAKYPKP
jgi:hypothetical protein